MYVTVQGNGLGIIATIAESLISLMPAVSNIHAEAVASKRGWTGQDQYDENGNGNGEEEAPSGFPWTTVAIVGGGIAAVTIIAYLFEGRRR